MNKLRSNPREAKGVFLFPSKNELSTTIEGGDRWKIEDLTIRKAGGNILKKVAQMNA